MDVEFGENIFEYHSALQKKRNASQLCKTASVHVSKRRILREFCGFTGRCLSLCIIGEVLSHAVAFLTWQH